MHALAEQHPNVEFHGVGGDSMLAQGLQAIASIEQLSVNGFVDPLLRVGSLYALYRRLVNQLSGMDVVVGVDFNVFNLIVERALRKRRVSTAHYVSPSVYAWRRGRIKRIKKAVDVIMTLFPFETQVYKEQGVKAVFVGHPTADRFDPDATKDQLREASRAELAIEQKRRVICVMPGSRNSELKFHFKLFLQAVSRLQEKLDGEPLKVIVPSGHRNTNNAWLAMHQEFADLDLEVSDRAALDILAASDMALVKSGTSTLEAMLVKTPMVVAYRLGSLTYRVVKSLMYIDRVALPNILSGRELVPELLQDDATPESLASALHEGLVQDISTLESTFKTLHEALKQNAAQKAASTVLALVRTQDE